MRTASARRSERATLCWRWEKPNSQVHTEPRLTIITPNLPMPSDPVVDVNAPPQQPNCYQDSDCRTGYTCNKGAAVDPNSPEFASFHGDCGRAEQTACRTDQDCLSDEYCQHSKLINNATGAVCFERPIAN